MFFTILPVNVREYRRQKMHKKAAKYGCAQKSGINEKWLIWANFHSFANYFWLWNIASMADIASDETSIAFFFVSENIIEFVIFGVFFIRHARRMRKKITLIKISNLFLFIELFIFSIRYSDISVINRRSILFIRYCLFIKISCGWD